MSITKYDSRLIQRPHNVPVAQRTLWGVVTAVFWMLYLYLWIPLVTLVAWFLGLREGWIQLYREEQQVEPFILVALPIICVICAITMIAWGEYNRRRFSKANRRGAIPEASHDEVARSLGATPELASRLSTARTVTVVMDEHARPVRLLEPPVTQGLPR
jgi:biofilm PGA synthesis protein PgaD